MNKSYTGGYYNTGAGGRLPNPAQVQKHRLIDSSARELAQTINNAKEVLASAKTVFPFTLFPDDITLDRAKLTIARREFFGTAEVMSIRIEDILNVTADVGPFLGSLKVFTRFYNTNKPYKVHFLRKRDALRIKRILQGYIIALQKEIDCSTLPTLELATMLDDLGK